MLPPLFAWPLFVLTDRVLLSYLCHLFTFFNDNLHTLLQENGKRRKKQKGERKAKPILPANK